MDANGGDVFIAEAESRPGLAGIGRFPEAVTTGGVAADIRLTAAYPDDVGILRINRDRADRAAEIVVGGCGPVLPAVDGLEHAAASGAHPVFVGSLHRARRRNRSAAARRTNFTPSQRTEGGGVEGQRARWRGRDLPTHCGACHRSGGLGIDGQWEQAEQDERTGAQGAGSRKRERHA